LEEAVGREVAGKILSARDKLGGQFGNEQQLYKEANLDKKLRKKLMQAFPRITA
jgi:hypothetical protein